MHVRTIERPLCIYCTGKLYYSENKNYLTVGTVYTVACYDCGKVYQRGTDKDDFVKWNFWSDPEDTKEYGRVWTEKEATEANKKAENCVVCGDRLKMHPSVGVKYCKCVEKLKG